MSTLLLSQLEVRIAEPGEGLKTVASSHGSQFLLPALLLSGLLNLVAGSHLVSSFFPQPLQTAPEKREDWTEANPVDSPWTEQLIEANYPNYSVESMQLGGEGELEASELEQTEQVEVEGEEQTFEDMYTPEIYYNLPRSLPVQYYGIA